MKILESISLSPGIIYDAKSIRYLVSEIHGRVFVSHYILGDTDDHIVPLRVRTMKSFSSQLIFEQRCNWPPTKHGTPQHFVATSPLIGLHLKETATSFLHTETFLTCAKGSSSKLRSDAISSHPPYVCSVFGCAHHAEKYSLSDLGPKILGDLLECVYQSMDAPCKGRDVPIPMISNLWHFWHLSW